MTQYSTNLLLAATAYIYSENREKAGSTLSTIVGSEIDVRETGRFLQWIEDPSATAPLHFCSSMTLLGVQLGSTLTERTTKARKHAERSRVLRDQSWVANQAPSRGKSFAVDLILSAEALIHGESEPAATRWISTQISKAISVDDRCWSCHGADPSSRLTLSPVLQVLSQASSLSEAVLVDPTETLVAKAVLAEIVAKARHDPTLMATLKARALEMRSKHQEGQRNLGFMSDSAVIEMMLETCARQVYRNLPTPARHSADQGQAWRQPRAGDR